ncbi:MAG: orc1/cdc6 family replication initiation protein [Candidatus Aenigmarchaeota archaeon]|nr:orc1/cdc6 family replication initiation protein [Candidatus Aenigmarchaeota archaeon]
MRQLLISEILEECLSKASLFHDKEALSSRFYPNELPHREEQLSAIIRSLTPAIKGEGTNNLFIYGQPGTGKTAAMTLVGSKIMERAGDNVVVISINCRMGKVADTEYRLLAEISRQLGREVPATGLPTQEVYSIFFRLLEEKSKTLILILDEIDVLLDKCGDGFLYNLTRINETLSDSRVCIVGISNNLLFSDYLDPRTKSSLCEEKVLFQPYDAAQLRDILSERAAFCEGVIGQGVIEKCAALAAQEHGDARRAMNLLRAAGEIAENAGHQAVMEIHVDAAKRKLDFDCLSNAVKTQPKHGKAVIMSLISLKEKGVDKIQTGDLYSTYQRVCKQLSLEHLTPRRVYGITGELEMQGLMTTKVVNKGRYGRTRHIELSVNDETLGTIKGALSEYC